MADTKHAHATPAAPVEGDGINYRGILWFMVILTVTTVVCQGLMWGMLKYFIADANSSDTGRAATSTTTAAPAISDGNMVLPGNGSEMPPPYLQTREPLGLERFRANEEQILTTYGWINKNDGVVRIPIDRAKDLLLDRGIPGGKPMPAGSVMPGTADAAATPAAPAKPPVKIKKD